MTDLETRRAAPDADADLGAHELSGAERKALFRAVLLAAVGMFFSVKLTGRFALSNVFFVVALAILLVGFPRVLRARDVTWYIVCCASVLVGAVNVALGYGYVMRIEHAAFFAVAGLYIVVIVRIVQNVATAADTIFAALRATVFPVLAYVVVRLALDLVMLDQSSSALGFDDKSHAALVCCIYAFLALRLMSGRARMLVALAFYAVALLTISRLPLIFAPFLVVALLAEYVQARRAARTAWDVFTCHLLLAIIVALPFLVAARAGALFTVFARFATGPLGSDASTEAHLRLIDYALQLKAESWANVVFGITPGGFASVVMRSRVDTLDYAAIDPHGYAQLVDGTAPMHSSHVSVLVEFSVLVAVFYVALLVGILRALVRRRDVTTMLFFLPFLAATTLYSSHNEIYFYIALTFAIAAGGRHRAPRAGAGRRGGGRWAPMTPTQRWDAVDAAPRGAGPRTATTGQRAQRP
ncbi:hypothetical protein [Cellulomonas sp. P5_C5]